MSIDREDKKYEDMRMRECHYTWRLNDAAAEIARSNAARRRANTPTPSRKSPPQYETIESLVAAPPNYGFPDPAGITFLNPEAAFAFGWRAEDLERCEHYGWDEPEDD